MTAVRRPIDQSLRPLWVEAVWKRLATSSKEHLGINQADLADALRSFLRLIGFRSIK